MYWTLLYVILILISALSFFNKKNERQYSIFSFTIAYFFTINGYFNGVDWVNYGVVFQDAKTFEDFLWSFEPLFGVFLFLCKSIFDDFYISVIVFYTIVFTLLYVSISQFFLKINRTVFITLFITINDISIINDQLRQLVAVVLCIYGLNFIFERKYKYFAIFNLIAGFFHYSAIITLAIYPVILQRKKIVVITGVSICVFSTLLLSIPSIITSVLSGFGFVGSYIAGKIDFYAENSVSKFGFFAIVDICVMMFYLFNRQPQDVKVAALWSGVFISACSHLSFYSFPVFQRINPYFFIFYCFLGSYYLNGELFFKSRRGLFSVAIAVLLSVVCFYKFLADDMRQGFFDYDSYLVKYAMGEFNFAMEKNKKCIFLSKANTGFCRW
ncbi:EpsG family protein [Serratia fonticola]